MKPELAAKLDAISALLEDSDGEVDAQIEALVADLEGDVEAMADWWGKSLRALERQQAACKAETDFWAVKAKRFEARASALKNRIQEDMEAMGIKKVKTDLFAISLQPSPPSVRITEDVIELLPHWAKKIETKPDKKAIAAKLKEGVALDFAELVTSEHVRVR